MSSGRIRRALPALAFVAIALGLGHSVATEQSCYVVNVGEQDTSYAVAQSLQSQGWYGVAGDGAERLYSPGCAA